METINRYYRDCTLRCVASLKNGKTILSDVYFTPPFKIMKPFHIKKDWMTVMQQTASAGILAGDQQDLSITVEENAKMEYVSQSFEKLHKMDGGSAERVTTLKVAKNAFLKYTPLPTIPYKDSAYTSIINAELEDDTSRFILLEILTGGRIAYGEKFEYRHYNSHIQVRKGGKLIFNDNAQYRPLEIDMQAMGMYEDFTHMANLVFFNMQDTPASDLDMIREFIEKKPKIQGGASKLESGDTSVRLLGTSAQDLYDLCDAIIKETV